MTFPVERFRTVLRQSICNQPAFSVWLDHLIQILCANFFEMESESLSFGDAQ